MASVTRVNGYLTNFTTGTLRSTQQHKAFLIRVRSTSDGSNTDVDLQTEDGDAASEADQIVELIIKELNPAMYFVPSAASGYIHVIMDGHSVDATSIAARIEHLDGVGTDTTVTLGTSITVA